MAERKKVFRGDRLREARVRRGMSQAALAHRTQASAAQIRRYELQNGDPSVELLTRLAGALNVSADWLVGISDMPDRYPTELSQAELHLIQAYRRCDAAAIVRIAASRLDA
jgi:transcriptional regulator with XRE-family HTH domain